jgi:hypothetical protein
MSIPVFPVTVKDGKIFAAVPDDFEVSITIIFLLLAVNVVS